MGAAATLQQLVAHSGPQRSRASENHLPGGTKRNLLVTKGPILIGRAKEGLQ